MFIKRTALLILGLLVFFILLVLIPLIINNKFVSFIRENWPNVLIMFFLAVFAAYVALQGLVIGDYWQRRRAAEVEKYIFTRKMAMFFSEVSQNLSKLKKMRNLKPNTYAFLELQDVALKDIVTSPLMYKYTGEEFMYAVRSYLAGQNIIGNKLKLFNEIHLRNGDSTELTENINLSIEQAIYLSTLLEYQLQFYANIYKIGWSIKPPNYDEVMKYLKAMKNDKKTLESDIIELEKKVTEMIDMPNEKCEEYSKGLKKALDKLEGF